MEASPSLLLTSLLLTNSNTAMSTKAMETTRTMKSAEHKAGLSWPVSLIPPSTSFESRSSTSSPTKSYTYRTPGLSISRSFDKEAYTNAKDPSSLTAALVHMPSVVSPTRSTRAEEYPKQPLKGDDGSDTSDTTGSREDSQVENLEVEVVSMEMAQGFVEDGVVVPPARTAIQVEKDKQYDGSNQNNMKSSNNKPRTKELDEQLPERQKTAMQAFLTSPTNLNWDDLVRSMREEMFIQTITIQQNKSDDSSLGSLESGSKGENKSIISMDSSLSSKSAFRKRSRGRSKIKGGPASGRRKKRESLEKQVEKVLLTKKRTSNSKNSRQNRDESHPLLKKSQIVGGKRCAFSAVTKLPSIPCSPNTPLDPPADDEVVPHPIIERGSWFNPVEQQPVTACESSGVVVPRPVGTSRQSQSLSDVKESPSQSQAKADSSISNSTEDPPLLLKLSTSGDSDEDSFYYHIRGKSSSKSNSGLSSPSRSKSGGSRSKTERQKNPYAFSNHPLLPVVEEGNISPFPTTFDELDSDGEPDVDRRGSNQQVEELENAVGQALGSFAASIGKAGPNSNQARLQMYKSKSNSRPRKRSLWQIICCQKTKATF